MSATTEHDEVDETTDAPEVKVRIATLTPRLAGQLLQRNTHNRSVSTARVDQYAADIRNGNWRMNGEAVKIAHTGQILDGQHRLMAILEADQPIETLFITGLAPEAQETMDQGRSRTLGDVLKLRGEKDYYNLGAATRMVCLYERDGLPFQAPFKAAPTVHEALRTLERNPDLRDSVKLASSLRRTALIPVSTIAGVHYLFAIVSADDANDFMTKLLRGENLTADSPIYVLRDRLMVDLQERALQPKVKLAFVIRTWNAYQQGEHIKRLMWTPGGASPDRFPAIHGLARPGGEEGDDV
jgi:hypothetical protein